ncbi:MAG: hypothetical protein RRA15_11625 [bacterium]|nr:hypothetical protein [bacterium]MDT8367115.1 hypothetical protein [bacterium]
MKRFVGSVGVFFSRLGGCFSKAWQDSDRHYHIPKSRFGGGNTGGEGGGCLPRQEKPVPRNAFLGSFRDCVGRAWEEADTWYHIPKSRFADPEFNQIAYSAAEVQGVLGRVGVFFRTLGDCVSMAWKESDHYHHLPKSRYQDPGFVREKMATAPKPQARFVIRPLIVGMGVAGEGIEDGWLARPSRYRYDEEFIVPEDGGGSRKPEIELE